nr:bulb-type lectin domain-containing protein [Tanacetum cinerariifolium]
MINAQQGSVMTCEDSTSMVESHNKFLEEYFESIDPTDVLGELPPVIGVIKVDFMGLYKFVDDLGGYINVSFNNKWNEIAKLLGLAQEYQEAVKECYKEFIGMVKIYYEEAKRSKQERPGKEVRKKPVSCDHTLTTIEYDHNNNKTNKMLKGGKKPLVPELHLVYPSSPVARTSSFHVEDTGSVISSCLLGESEYSSKTTTFKEDVTVPIVSTSDHCTLQADFTGEYSSKTTTFKEDVNVPIVSTSDHCTLQADLTGPPIGYVHLGTSDIPTLWRPFLVRGTHKEQS